MDLAEQLNMEERRKYVKGAAPSDRLPYHSHKHLMYQKQNKQLTLSQRQEAR